MTGVILALVASLTWGTADFFGGTLSRRLAPLTVVIVAHTAGMAVLVVVVVAAGAGEISGRLLVVAALAGLAQAVGLCSYYQSLSVGSMGVVAPIVATAAVVPVAFGLASGERPSTVQAAGMALTLTGVAMAAYERRDGDGTAEGRRVAIGAGFALLAALGIGLFLTGLAEASESGGVFAAVLVSRIVAIAAMVAIIAWVSTWTPPSTQHLVPLALVGVAGMLATVLFTEATTHGLVSLVSVLGAMYPLITVLLARSILRERLGPVQQGGAGLALVGVATIIAG